MHDFKDPLAVLLNARKMLKPTGLLIDLDWKKESLEFGPPLHVRFSEEHAKRLIEESGFVINTVKISGPYHYMITARL